MHPKSYFKKPENFGDFLKNKFCFGGITFLGALLHKGKFIFLKLAKNNEFFSTNHDLFLEKKFPTLLRGFFWLFTI